MITPYTYSLIRDRYDIYMSQYALRPMSNAHNLPRPVTDREYAAMIRYEMHHGICTAFTGKIWNGWGAACVMLYHKKIGDIIHARESGEHHTQYFVSCRGGYFIGSMKNKGAGGVIRLRLIRDANWITFCERLRREGMK